MTQQIDFADKAACKAFLDTIATLNVRLPLSVSCDHTGVVLDADERAVFTVDVENDRPDYQVIQIATLIAFAVNSCAGLCADQPTETEGAT